MEFGLSDYYISSVTKQRFCPLLCSFVRMHADVFAEHFCCWPRH